MAAAPAAGVVAEDEGKTEDIAAGAGAEGEARRTAIIGIAVKAAAAAAALQRSGRAQLAHHKLQLLRLERLHQAAHPSWSTAELPKHLQPWSWRGSG